MIGGATTAGILFAGASTLSRIGYPTRDTISFIGLMVALIVLASTMSVKPVPTLSRRWIVPRRWGAYGGNTFAALFGFSMGLGWRTRVGSNVYWVLLLGGLAAPRFLTVCVPFVLFALVRSAPVALIAARNVNRNVHCAIPSISANARQLAGLGGSSLARLASAASLVAYSAAALRQLLRS